MSIVNLNQWVTVLEKAKELSVAGCCADAPDSEITFHYVDIDGLEHEVKAEFPGPRAPDDPELPEILNNNP